MRILAPINAKVLKKAIFAALLILTFSGVYAAAWAGGGLDLNTSSARSIDGVTATINYSGSDLNAVCFNTSDSSSGSTCYTTEAASPISIPLSSSLTGISSDNIYLLYAFLKQDDGNYSSSSVEAVLIDSTAPVLSAAYPADGGDYNSTSFTGDLNVTDASTIGTPLIKVDGSTASVSTTSITNGKRFTFSTGALSEADHNITLDVNDSLGNRLTSTIAFTVDLTVPSSASISSSYSSNWTNDTQPDFSVSGSDASSGLSGGQAALSCGATGPWYYTTYNTTISDFNIVSSTYGCSASDGNRTVYVKLRDKAGNWMSDANAASANVRYDATAPSTPTNLSASAGNSKATLTWTAPSADASSGNSRIEVYVNGTYKTDTNYGDTNVDANGLTNGTTYSIKIRTKDAAGNYSPFTSEVSVTPASTVANLTVKKDNSNVQYAKNGDVLSASCLFTSDATSAIIKYKYYLPNTSDANLATGSGSSLNANLTVNSAQNSKEVWIWCEASGAINSGTKKITLDNTLPIVAWKSINDTISGTQRVEVSAGDSQEMGGVNIGLNGVEFAASSGGGDNYYYDLNSEEVENGTYTIKASAYDAAGNTAIVEKEVKIENITSEAQKAQKVLDSAAKKQASANLLVAFFNKEAAAVPAQLNEKKKQGDALLELARNDFNESPGRALEEATSASALFEEFNSKAKIETIQGQAYEYDLNSVAEQLTQVGFSAESAEKEKDAIALAHVERKLEIISAGSDEKWQVRVLITIKNDTNDTGLKIVEVIPKEFASSAAKIISGTEFRILKDDPVIELSLSAQIGEMKTISYGFGEMTKEEAQKLFDSNSIQKFASPPIVLASSERAEELMGGYLSSTGNLLIVAAIVAVAILIIAGVAVFGFAKPGNGLGREKSIMEQITSKRPENEEAPTQPPNSNSGELPKQ